MTSRDVFQTCAPEAAERYHASSQSDWSVEYLGAGSGLLGKVPGDWRSQEAKVDPHG
jgi:hypothetical protein